MLIVFDPDTGEVLDNHGTNSAWPDGPPDEMALVNLPDRSLDTVGLLRLHDEHDADTVAAVLTNRHHVDPARGVVVIDGPYPPPVPAEVPVPAEERLAALEEEVRGLRESVQGMRSSAAAEAAKASPTAKGVAEAVARGGAPE